MNETIGNAIVGLLAGWLTLAVGIIVYLAVRRWWQRQRYGAPIDHSLLLIEYGRQLAGALDRHTLEQVLLVELPRVFSVERAALLLPEAYQLLAVSGDELRLSTSHAAVRWAASGGETQRADRGRLRELIRQGRTDLDWTCAWVPLMRGTDLRGLWLLGTRSGGAQYAPEDLRCLTDLGRQAAIALEAMQTAEQERRAASEIRTLYQRVVTATESERGRLARELHDGVLQDLCAVTRDLKALEVKPQTDPALITDLATRSGETVNTLRAICHDLRPPLLQHDLASALKALVEQLDARSTAPIHLDVSADGLHLSDEVAVAIFRITQEALNNAIQHANASEIEVRLTHYPDRLRLTITDDGRGISGDTDAGRFVAQGHFGLAGMRERAAMIGGKLEVQTAPDYGTVVVLEVPH